MLSLARLASSRHINKAYTINSANTWEHKSITFAGDTSGVVDNDNGIGFQVIWWLGAGPDFTSGTLQTSWGSNVTANRAVGQVNLADTIGNDWQITGVQLEVGDTATPFEHRSYGDELARCQRYYQKVDHWVSNGGLADSWYYSNVGFLTAMRASPSLVSATAYGLDTGNAITRQSSVNINGWQMVGSTPTSASVYSSNNAVWQQLAGRGHFDAEL